MTADASQTVVILVSSAFFYSHESDDGMRITAQGPCCVGVTKSCNRGKLSGNLAGITTNVQQQLSLLRREQEDVLIQRVSARNLLPNPEMVHTKRSKAECSVSMQHTNLINIHLSVLLCSWCPSCWDTVCCLWVIIMCFHLEVLLGQI